MREEVRLVLEAERGSWTVRFTRQYLGQGTDQRLAPHHAEKRCCTAKDALLVRVWWRRYEDE